MASYCSTAGHTPGSVDPRICAMCGAELSAGTASELGRVACNSCGADTVPLDIDKTITSGLEVTCRKCAKKPRCFGCQKRATRLTVPANGRFEDSRCGECIRRASRAAIESEPRRIAFADAVLAELCDDIEEVSTDFGDLDRAAVELVLLRVPAVFEALCAHYQTRATKRLEKP